MQYPCITPLSADWNNIYYSAEVEFKKDSIIIEHVLESSNAASSIIFDFIDKEYIKYITEIRCPRTLYSQIYSNSSPRYECKFDINSVGSEYFIIPMLCAIKDFDLPTDDLSEIWKKQYAKTLPIKYGTIIGKSKLWANKDARASLLRFEVYPDIENSPPADKSDGIMRVEHQEGDTPFVAYVNQATMQALEQPGNIVSKQIERVALVGVFAKLHSMAQEGEDQEESEIQSVDRRILEAIQSDLERANVPIWDDDNFDAALAATVIAPCFLYGNSEEGEIDY